MSPLEVLHDEVSRRVTNWKWRLYEYWRSLSAEDAASFLWRLDYFGEKPLSALERAEFFMILWNTEQVWDYDSELASLLMLVFHGIEGDAVTAEEQEYVAAVKRACPHLSELDDSDVNWTGYRLPVDRNQDA